MKSDDLAETIFTIGMVATLIILSLGLVVSMIISAITGQ